MQTTFSDHPIIPNRNNCDYPDLLQAITEKTSLWQYLAEVNKPILLYGMGDGADKMIHYLAGYGKQINGVFASDGFVRNHQFRGFPVMRYQQAVERFGEFIVLVAFGTQKPEVIANICRIAQEQELYAPNVPLFGEGLFDYEFVLENQKAFQQAYETMADTFSRRTFVALCQYGISGKINYLMDVVAETAEAYQLLNLHSREVYLDLGAYNGDTVNLFLQKTNGYQALVAVEPDPKNYQKLCKTVEGLKNVICLNNGIGDAEGIGYFAAKAGRNSCFTKELSHSNCKEINIITIDKIQRQFLPQQPLTYIKMDVEGAEREALLGGKDVLAAYQPKLLVSGYHRNEDLFLLPNLIKQLNPGYRIYLRHHLYIPGWENNFYAV